MAGFSVPSDTWIAYRQVDLKTPVKGSLFYRIGTLDGRPYDIEVKLEHGGFKSEIKLPGLARQNQETRTEKFQLAAILLEWELTKAGSFGMISRDDAPIYRRLKKPRTGNQKQLDETLNKPRQAGDWRQNLWNNGKR